MEFINEILNFLGLQLDESAPDLVKFSLFYLILSCFLMLNVLNICIYLISIFIVTHEKFLNLIPKNYYFIYKLINYYKNIRIGFIIFEVVLLVFLLYIMISVSYDIVSYYLIIK